MAESFHAPYEIFIEEDVRSPGVDVFGLPREMPEMVKLTGVIPQQFAVPRFRAVRKTLVRNQKGVDMLLQLHHRIIWKEDFIPVTMEQVLRLHQISQGGLHCFVRSEAVGKLAPRLKHPCSNVLQLRPFPFNLGNAFPGLDTSLRNDVRPMFVNWQFGACSV